MVLRSPIAIKTLRCIKKYLFRNIFIPKIQKILMKTSLALGALVGLYVNEEIVAIDNAQVTVRAI